MSDNRALVTIPTQAQSPHVNSLDERQSATNTGTPHILGHYPLLKETTTSMDSSSPRVSYRGSLDRCMVSESRYFLLFGWLSDEGNAARHWRLYGEGCDIDIPGECVLRYARPDLEASFRGGAFDYGFMIFGRLPPRSFSGQPLLFEVKRSELAFHSVMIAETASDNRLLDVILSHISAIDSHSGKEFALNRFVSGLSGSSMIQLFQSEVKAKLAGVHIERFRPRRTSTSFITVTFGTIEAMMMQPVLFAKRGLDAGEWIYVCNSPEDGAEALRVGRTFSELYNLMITVIVVPGNVGFGAGNNVAVENASGSKIFLINPDVFPLSDYSRRLGSFIAQPSFGESLWGGLLFYDTYNLMHSGMYIEADTFLYRQSLNPGLGTNVCSGCTLLRVEHFDKGVPFVDSHWRLPVSAPAITGAAMAFDRGPFEELGGFSTSYIYGHYEDADLSIRWKDKFGGVFVHPDVRLIHLEGQGSRPRGSQYGGAAMVNRYLFSRAHFDTVSGRRAEFGRESRLDGF